MSNELEAFLEYISITRALSKKSVEAYTNDLLSIEIELKKPLIKLDLQILLKLLSKYENKRTLNRKLSSVNSFLIFVIKINLTRNKQNSSLRKYLNCFLSFCPMKISKRGLILLIDLLG